jgi:hypothetical protein
MRSVVFPATSGSSPTDLHPDRWGDPDSHGSPSLTRTSGLRPPWQPMKLARGGGQGPLEPSCPGRKSATRPRRPMRTMRWQRCAPRPRPSPERSLADLPDPWPGSGAAAIPDPERPRARTGLTAVPDRCSPAETGDRRLFRSQKPAVLSGESSLRTPPSKGRFGRRTVRVAGSLPAQCRAVSRRRPLIGGDHDVAGKITDGLAGLRRG